jgi:hypothetical protein
MEVQLTDFENAAFTVFIVLITRVILAFDLGLYIPLSKVDENMNRAHKRDAIRRERFFFRKHIAPPEIVSSRTSPAEKADEVKEVVVGLIEEAKQVLEGKSDGNTQVHSDKQEDCQTCRAKVRACTM